MLAWPHSGFSLNGDVRIEAEDREALGRLLRYVLRPAVALKRLNYDAAVVEAYLGVEDGKAACDPEAR